jgi:hypothetical protein
MTRLRVKCFTLARDGACYVLLHGQTQSLEEVMTLELVQKQSAPAIDPNLMLTGFVSILGLAVTLALLPLFSSDFGAWLALAG